MISPGVFHGAYGLCSRLRSTSDGFRNAEAACDMLVSGVKTRSEVPTRAKALRRLGVLTANPLTALATLLTLSHSAGSPMTIIGIPGARARTDWSVATNLPSGHRRFGSDAERLTSSRLVVPDELPLSFGASISRACFHDSSARAFSSSERKISGCQSTNSGLTPNGTARLLEPSM